MRHARSLTIALLLLAPVARGGQAGELPPPASHSPVLVTSNTEGSWDSRTFVFDGAGNIIGIGSDVYTYDRLGRIERAGVTSSGATTTDSYSYDAFGNLYERELNGSAGLSTLPVPVDWKTNQLEDAEYDGAGNLTYHDATHRYEWDPMRMLSSRNDGQDVYIYTAGDERIAVKSGETWKWSLRDLGGKVLREMESTGPTGAGQWQWVEDFVHRDGQIVAAERPAAQGGRRHMHLDHLGTPRLLTDANGQAISRHDFLPFGIELTSIRQERDRGTTRENKLRFTGHERDFVGGTTNENVDTLDYMHGRYFRSELGRFLSVDPLMDIEKNLPESQRWNRYAYVTNNPLIYDDPDGRERRILLVSFRTPDAMRLQSILDHTVSYSEGWSGDVYDSGYTLDVRHSLGGKSLLHALKGVDNSGTDIVVINSHGGKPLQTDTGGGADGSKPFSFGAAEIAKNLGGRPQAIVLAGCGTMDSAQSVANATGAIVFGIASGAQAFTNQISRAGAVLANVYAATGNANFAMAVANRMLTKQYCPNNGGSCAEYPQFQSVKPAK